MMKKIIIGVLLLCSIAGYSQQLQNTDTVRKFTNKYIRNSAVDAFTNLRLNTVLISLANLIDSAALGTGATINLTKTNGSTSITITPSGGGTPVVIDSANATRSGVITVASWKFLDSLHRGLISIGEIQTFSTPNDSTFRVTTNGVPANYTIKGGKAQIITDTTLTVHFGAGGAPDTLSVASPGGTVTFVKDATLRDVGGAVGVDTVNKVATKYDLTQISAGAGMTTLTGDVTASGTGSVATTLATVNSNVGSFTNANITVNAKGLITAAANGSGGGGGSSAIGGAITSATQGSVLYAGLGGKLGQQNSKFYWDSVAFRLGINTNTVDSNLTVNGSGNVKTNLNVGTNITLGNKNMATVSTGTLLDIGNDAAFNGTRIFGGGAGGPKVQVDNSSISLNTGSIFNYGMPACVGCLTVIGHASDSSWRQVTISSLGGSVNNFHKAYVDSANGNNTTAVVGRPDKPFATIDSALGATISYTSRTIVVGLGTYAAPSYTKIKSNTTIIGSGKPQFNNTITGGTYPNITVPNPTALVGGTIIQGTFKIPLGAQNFVMTDVGIDVGSAFIGGGNAVDGLVAANDTLANTTMVGKVLRKGLRLQNISVLQKADTVLKHGVVIEASYQPLLENIDTYGGFAGVVSKNIGATLRTIKSRHCNTFNIIIKQNSYAYAYNTLLDGFEINDGAGLVIQNEDGDNGAGMQNITVSNGHITDVTFGVAGFGNFISKLLMSNVHVTNTSGKGFNFPDLRNSNLINCSVENAIDTGFNIVGKNTRLTNCLALGGSTFDYNLTGGSSSSQPMIVWGCTALSLNGGFKYNGSLIYGDGNYGGGRTGNINVTSETAAVLGTTVIHNSLFTGSGNLSSYTPDLGNAWVLQNSSAWTLGSGRVATSGSSPSGAFWAATTDIATTNFVAAVKGSRAAGTLAIMLRWTDLNNCVIALVTGTDITYYDKVAGVVTSFATDTGLSLGTIDNIFSINVHGSTFTTTVNGVAQTTHTFPTTQAGTLFGIGSAGAAGAGDVSFDYVTITN